MATRRSSRWARPGARGHPVPSRSSFQPSPSEPRPAQTSTPGASFAVFFVTESRPRKARMRAIVQERYGAPERVLRLEERDRPSVGDGDVLVRVRATSVNTPDWITVAGVPYILRLRSGLRRPRTPVRGTDLSGVVGACPGSGHGG